MKVFATAAVVSFVISIAAAALLLLTLPEIAQNLRPEINIWLTKGSIMGWLLGMNTQSLAIGESFFFGLGVICFAGLIVGATWSQAPCSKT